MLAYYTKNGGADEVGDATLGIDALPKVTGGKRDLSDVTPPFVQFRWGMGVYLGENMDDRRITVPGVGDCLLLWEPGDPSPFQAANTYAFSIAAPSETSRITAFLEKKAAGTLEPANVNFKIDTTSKRVSLLVKDTDFREDFYNWYPFWTAPPEAPINLLYGPDRDALEGLLGLELVVQALQPVEGYVLGSEVVPGSVRVTVNGVEERRFTFDKSTGRLTFQVEIASTDRIEVRWRTADIGSAGGDVLLTWRDDIQLTESLGFWAAAGLRWNVGSGFTAGEPYSRSGAVVAAAGLEGSVGEFDWSVNAAGSFANPDTTGVVRLHGMEGHSLEVDLSEERAWPAAPPDADDDPELPDDDDGPLEGLHADNRGRLLYRDYWKHIGLGGFELQNRDWTAPLVEYDDGGRSGPYNVRGSSAGTSDGRSLVIEYDLPNGGDWVGTQLPVAAGSLPDLSTAKSITVRYQRLGLEGDVQLYMEVGAIGEDIDDDGAPDAEDSATSSGFPFNYDPSNLVKKLWVGAGPGMMGNRVKDSEDRDGSGTLTAEERLRIVQKTDSTDLRFTGAITDPDWSTYVFELGDADRAKLQQARSIRIVLIGLAPATSGRILIDRISIAGSAYWAESSNDTATVREVSEHLLGSDDPGEGNRLGDVEPEAMELFHTAGETQEVLAIALGCHGDRCHGDRVHDQTDRWHLVRYRGRVPQGNGQCP